ncbi:MAG TPA: hypothetical protein VJC39_03810 [Candidatus Nanoarchaeia archaeon]|nr:hypothetical protein [Candidatus Nanoarchaeia archaeon]
MKKSGALIFVLISTLFISLAQVLFKLGSETLQFNFSLLINKFILGGFLLYGLGAVLIIISLRGQNLTFIYPVITTSYIWVSLLSVYVFHESMHFYKIWGILLIIFGIILIGLGDKNNIRKPKLVSEKEVNHD